MQKPHFGSKGSFSAETFRFGKATIGLLCEVWIGVGRRNLVKRIEKTHLRIQELS